MQYLGAAYVHASTTLQKIIVFALGTGGIRIHLQIRVAASTYFCSATHLRVATGPFFIASSTKNVVAFRTFSHFTFARHYESMITLQ